MDDKTKVYFNHILIRGYLIVLIAATACSRVELPTTSPSLQISDPTHTDIPHSLPVEETQTPTITQLPPTGTIPPTETPIPSPELQAEERDSCDDWELYSNQEYGFTLCYPPDWTIHRAEHHDINGKIIDVIEVSKNEFTLSILYWDKLENIEIMESGIGSGELEELELLSFMGQEIQKSALIYEGKTKNVFYKGPDGFVSVNELVFILVLSYTMEGSYEVVDIPREIRAEVDEILKSFTR